METLSTDVLIIGGGAGGTAAALQAARRGVRVILVSEFPWLGGMLTSAGVAAPDGNELAAFQTGIWGAFLRELQQRQAGGLDNAWVSFFTYDPRVGGRIFADWVKALPNLTWIVGRTPLAVIRQSDRILGVQLADIAIQAHITLDATELGDLLALGEIPHHWGWEAQSDWGEPSAPVNINDVNDPHYSLIKQYPVQAPTWVVVMQDYGAGATAPEIPDIPDLGTNLSQFEGAWEGYGGDTFLNYGRLPGDRFMINWPLRGNDYGVHLDRLVQSETTRRQYLQEARQHSQAFARYIQTNLGRRYGLAEDIFPNLANNFGGGAYALCPYYRESRRLQGITTIREQDILPIANGQIAALPLDDMGQVSAIALGAYANDHHYPGVNFPVKAKSLHWGGRRTGSPFAIPYGALIPKDVDGFMVCEKNISVSHIANGATRLQPVVLAIGQAAGMAAALSVEARCQPRQLPVRRLQEMLLTDKAAPAAIIPLFNLPPNHNEWSDWQRFYLNHPDKFPKDGHCPLSASPPLVAVEHLHALTWVKGTFIRPGNEEYLLTVEKGLSEESPRSVSLVTLRPEVHQSFKHLKSGNLIQVWGRLNKAGQWLLVDALRR
ncbi:MAG: FAD-dependent oxidoreductase [Leptolyngbyaceae cyanobacterium MO_188.B28]|nr:FAD-dependent oxidoreductase [Leptolyngbyaceae cyanobacterium MO_188.B28]